MQQINYTRRIIAVSLMIILIFTIGDFGKFNTLIANAAYQSQPISKNSPYLIKINKKQNCVTVYKKDTQGEYTIPIKSMICSVGYDTPLGTFRTPEKYRWRLLMGDVWGQYSTRIVGGILFHSVWYYKQDNSTLSYREYNKLGTTASHGCVRLTTIDAKWIYDNCPIGTSVVIYESNDPGPLGKPVALKLPTTGWDPTDPDPKNPWINKQATISGVKNQTIELGKTVSITEGITAKSKVGIDITKDIVVDGKVDFKTPGKYTVTYTITDASGSTDSKKAIFTIKGNLNPPKLLGIKDKVVSKDEVVGRDFAMNGVSAKWDGKMISSNKIDTKIKYKKATKTYTITYSVKADNGKTTKKTAFVKVDTEPPIIMGVKDKKFKKGEVIDKDYVLKGITAYDNGKKLQLSKIKVVISENMDKSYAVRYRVTDSVGNRTTLYALFYRESIDTLFIHGASDHIISQEDIMNEELALKGVTATDEDEDITDQIEVSISELQDSKYIVTYTVTNDEGEEKVVTVVFQVDDN